MTHRIMMPPDDGKIVVREDGWIVRPEDKGRIPAQAALMMLRNLPPFDDGRSITAIRVRMLRRHLRAIGYV